MEEMKQATLVLQDRSLESKLTTKRLELRAQEDIIMDLNKLEYNKI
jgi:hypothetical protein